MYRCNEALDDYDCERCDDICAKNDGKENKKDYKIVVKGGCVIHFTMQFVQ